MISAVSSDILMRLKAVDEHGPVPESGELRQLYFLKLVRKAIQEKTQELGRPLTACSVCFGCQMNARDSEKLSGVLEAAGFTLTEDENADFVIYNTCTVRDNADQHVYGRLGRITHYKRSNPAMHVALCGCMMQEESAVEKVRRSYPLVDLIFGTHNIYRFPEFLCRLYVDGAKRVVEIQESSDELEMPMPIRRAYPYKSGVNIMFGCDNFCSYCIVPYVRGRERSRPAEDILEEVRRLAEDGVTEVMLLGQNVNSYGRKLPNAISFPELLARVSEVPGIRRVRFMTPHPKDFGPDMIAVMKEHPAIARHIHLPLQSGSDRILRLMNRRYSQAEYLEKALAIRQELPECSITTDLIIGFPTETAADVDETLKVLDAVRFDNAYTFIYSIRRGTPAAKMEQVPEAEKQVQFDRVLKRVQEHARERSALLRDQVHTALIEEVNERTPGYVTGRLSNNLLVHVPGDAALVGQYKEVKLTDFRGFYYFGDFV